MKIYKSVIILGGTVLLLCLLLNSNRIGNMMACVFSSIAKSRISNTDSFWFSHIDIDSLYKEKKYKYFMFVSGSLDRLTIPQDSVLIIADYDSPHFSLKQNYDIIDLPKNIFDYLLKDGETSALCLVDSVVQAPLNRYKMRKIELMEDE